MQIECVARYDHEREALHKSRLFFSPHELQFGQCSYFNSNASVVHLAATLR
jgi:hypothetical protein